MSQTTDLTQLSTTEAEEELYDLTERLHEMHLERDVYTNSGWPESAHPLIERAQALDAELRRRHLTIQTQCPRCHETSHAYIPVEGYVAWLSGTLIQDAFPDLSEDEREALMTGLCPSCFDALCFDESTIEWPDDLPF